jgi:hypothetical protein
MLGVHESIIEGGYDLIPPSLSYCVTYVNPLTVSQLIIKGYCKDIQDLGVS